jgi:hypothetical protein
MFHTKPHLRACQKTSHDPAREDAEFAFFVDAMVSRRPRRPISLPRPPLSRGR